MKILAITPLYLPSLGGIELLVSSLAEVLSGAGIKMVIVTDSTGRLPETEVIDGTKVHRLNFAGAIRSARPSVTLEALSRFRSLVESEHPHIIHMHGVTGSSAWYVDRLLKGAMNKSVPFIITQHGVLEIEDRLRVIRDLLKRADAVTAVSNAALASAQEFSETRNAYPIIPNGIREAPSLKFEAEDQLPHRLICVGRLQREKGFDLAIEAVSSVRAAGIQVVLDIVGQGEERGALRELAVAAGVSDEVRLLGRVDHLQTRSMIARSTLLLAPSRTREGFGLVVAEAAMAGVPAIVTHVGGLPETVGHGETGLVIPVDSSKHLGDAIKALLEDPARRIAFSSRARHRALALYGLPQCAQRYVQLYQAILDKHNASDLADALTGPRPAHS